MNRRSKLALFILLAIGAISAAECSAPTELPDEVIALMVHTRDTRVYFPKSSDYLRLTERRKIEQLAGLMKASPEEILIITGKTDPRGDREFNDWLSDERSSSVRELLVSLGIPAERLQVAEPGNPSEPTKAGESASEMRRVDFSLQGRQEEMLQLEVKTAAIEDVKTPEALPFDPSKNFREPRRSDSGLEQLRATTAATKIYFEFTSSSVRAEYWRDLKRLALSLSTTNDAAVAITGFASPKLPAHEAARLAQGRAASTASKLNVLGVEWERMLIVAKPGETTHPAPHWRNHRVEFSPLVLREPLEEEPQLAETAIAPPREPSSSDSLVALTQQAVIYFGSNSAMLKPQDRRALEEIARLMSMPGEARSVVVRAFTDQWGDAEYNQQLCERRQNAVLDTLADFSAPIDRLVIEEATDPEQSDRSASWKQRRVELIVR